MPSAGSLGGGFKVTDAKRQLAATIGRFFALAAYPYFCIPRRFR
jgi:hypothetical protein